MKMSEEVQAQDMGKEGTSMEMKSPDAYKYDMDYHRFSSFLGVDRHKRGDQTLAGKVSLIYDWAKEKAGRDDRESIINVVRDYQKGLGVSFSGETLVNYLHRNMRVDMDGSRLKEDAKEVKNGMECGLTVKNFNDIKVGDVVSWSTWNPEGSDWNRHLGLILEVKNTILSNRMVCISVVLPLKEPKIPLELFTFSLKLVSSTDEKEI